MAIFLTLIAAPPPAALPAEEAIATLRRELAEAGGHPGPIHWLARDLACDIDIGDQVSAFAENIARERLRGASVDIAIQPVEGRRKRLLLADMESTIVTRELTDELAALAGMGEAITAMTAASMRGEVDFAAVAARADRHAAGQPAALLEQVKDLVELTPGARALVQTMKAHGARTALVSGGFDCFAAIAPRPAASTSFAPIAWSSPRAGSPARWSSRSWTGSPTRHPRASRNRTSTSRPLDAAAVGDGANDIPMLEAAGLGVAYHGKPGGGGSRPLPPRSCRSDGSSLSPGIPARGVPRVTTGANTVPKPTV